MPVLMTTFVLLLAYPYLLYPVMINALVYFYRPGMSMIPSISNFQPSVSVLLSVYNEENIIEEKIGNVINSKYPSELLDLIIVSDGSTDRTDELIQAWPSERVRLIRQGREGKTAALNRAVELSHAEILVFTDANTFFNPDAIARLTAPFADESIGLTTGRVIPQGNETGDGIFGRFETFLKQRESCLGVITGADGAIYALRHSLYRPLVPRIINDFFHPIAVHLAGYRSCIVAEALAHEESFDDLQREILRQRRMVNQAFEIMKQNLCLLIGQGKLLLVWVLLSHKLLRWLHLPIVMLISIGSFFALVHGSPVMAATVFAYWLMFLVGVVAERAGLRLLPGIIDLAYRFQVIHYAYFLGLVDNLRGKNAVVWNPRGGA